MSRAPPYSMALLTATSAGALAGRVDPAAAGAPGHKGAAAHACLLPVPRQLQAEFPLDPYMGVSGHHGDGRAAEGLGVRPRRCLPVHIPGPSCFIEAIRGARRGPAMVGLRSAAGVVPAVRLLQSARARSSGSARTTPAAARASTAGCWRSLLEWLNFPRYKLGMPRALACHLSKATD